MRLKWEIGEECRVDKGEIKCARSCAHLCLRGFFLGVQPQISEVSCLEDIIIDFGPL